MGRMAFCTRCHEGVDIYNPTLKSFGVNEQNDRKQCRLLWVWLPILGVVMSCVKSEAPLVLQNFTAHPSGRVLLCWYGVRNDKLLYAVFHNGMSEVTNRLGGTLTFARDGKMHGYQELKLPTGSVINLAESKSLYEINEGDESVLVTDLTVKVSDLQSFLQSSPESFSISSLFKFLGRPTPEIKALAQSGH
jgi:hypothetical protein